MCYNFDNILVQQCYKRKYSMCNIIDRFKYSSASCNPLLRALILKVYVLFISVYTAVFGFSTVIVPIWKSLRNLICFLILKCRLNDFKCTKIPMDSYSNVDNNQLFITVCKKWVSSIFRGIQKKIMLYSNLHYKLRQ